MLENDLVNLDNRELIELLAILEGIDSSLEEQEKILKERCENNENGL